MNFNSKTFIDFKNEINSTVSKVELFELIKRKYNETKLTLEKNGTTFKYVIDEDIISTYKDDELNSEAFSFFLIISDLERYFINEKIVDSLEYYQRYRNDYRSIIKERIKGFHDV